MAKGFEKQVQNMGQKPDDRDVSGRLIWWPRAMV
jgi:hypothetical protein